MPPKEKRKGNNQGSLNSTKKQKSNRVVNEELETSNQNLEEATEIDANKSKISQAQEWLDKNYPQEKREKSQVLFARGKDLEGELVIEDFPELEKIICDSNNKLESIKIMALIYYFTLNHK